MKAAGHKKTTVWLHFDKAPGIDKFIETEAWVVVAKNRGAGGRGHGDLLFNKFRVSVLDAGKVLDVDHSGGGGPTSRLCLMPLNYTLKND